MGFFDQFFCGEYIREVRENEETIASLKNTIAELSGKYHRCVRDKSRLALEKEDLAERVGELESLLESSIRVPEMDMGDGWVFSPHGSCVRKYVDMAADRRYLAFRKERWVEALDGIQPLVRNLLRYWQRDVSDCDDWNVVMLALMACMFRASGYNRQGGFALAYTDRCEDSLHAYNIFVTMGDEAYVYEPQTNTVKGRLGDFSEGIYHTGEIAFIT